MGQTKAQELMKNSIRVERVECGLTDTLSGAKKYIERTFSVLPVFGLRENGNCQCSQGAKCASPGKHPMPKSEGGWNVLHAKDEVNLRRIFGSGSGVNMGIATGEEHGIFVLDFDVAKGGTIESIPFQLPRTLTAKTGGGGLHHGLSVSAESHHQKFHQ